MFFQLMYIHLFRPFLQYTKETSPLPENVSPRKLCTAAASMISKLMRLYKRSHGLRQICNICVYIVHSACTIHLLNLPEKGAKRDIVHGVKHLEEIAEGWLCARRSLGMVSVLARKWKVELPDDAIAVLARTDRKFGPYTGDMPSPESTIQPAGSTSPRHLDNQQHWPAMSNGRAGHTLAANLSSTAGAPQAYHSRTSPTGIPSYDPTTTHALQHPQAFPPVSATGIPHQQQQPHQPASYPPATVASPSEMYPGNLEQLLQTSNDWAYRDQAQLATGFENWGSPAIWQDGFASQPPPVTTGGGGGGYEFVGQPLPGNGSNGFPVFGGGGFAGAVGRGYDEEEWYQ